MGECIKVCHITTVHPNRKDVRIFEKECVSLVENGYNVTLLVNDDAPDEIIKGVQIISLREKAKNRWDRITRIASMAYRKAMFINADIYHLHDPELLTIAIRLKKRGKKVIFDSHEFTSQQILIKTYIPLLARKLIAWIYIRYERYVLNCLDGLIAPCFFDGKDFFSDIHIPKTVIMNYPIVESKNQVNPSTKNETVCYVGLLNKNRGIDHMIKATAIAEKKLVLAGEMDENYKNELRNMQEWSCVEYRGKLSHEETMKVVSEASVGLLLSQYIGQYYKIDTLATKVYEYMSCGIPCVVSDFPYYCKTLEKYRFGIAVDPADDKSIANAIMQLFEKKELYEYMSNEGKRAIREEMNWQIESNKLVAFYDKLLR